MDAFKIQIYFLVIYFFEASIYIVVFSFLFQLEGVTNDTLPRQLQKLASRAARMVATSLSTKMFIKCCGHTSNGRFWRGWLIDGFYETDCNSGICHSESLTITAIITTTHHPPPPQYHILHCKHERKTQAHGIFVVDQHDMLKGNIFNKSHSPIQTIQKPNKVVPAACPYFPTNHQKSIILVRKFPPLHISSSYRDPQAYNVA